MIVLLLILLLYVSVVDIKTKVIADGITLLGILLALNYQVFYGDVKAAVLGMTAGIMIVWIMNNLRIHNVGGGDAKLIGLIGACTNWRVAIGTALMAYLVSLFRRQKRYRTQMSYAYAPYITIGFVLWTGILYFRI